MATNENCSNECFTVDDVESPSINNNSNNNNNNNNNSYNNNNDHNKNISENEIKKNETKKNETKQNETKQNEVVLIQIEDDDIITPTTIDEHKSSVPKETEKRERSPSVEISKPKKKKICRCHETCGETKETNDDTSNSNSTPNNKHVDSLSTASTGINENSNNSKGKINKNEPFKFFIGGIPQFISNATISDYFSKYGTVQNVMIAQDHRTKRNRGFAFVTMATQANRDKILKGPHELNGKRVDVREENNTTPSDIQRKIFVGGLNFFWTKDILADYFSAFGEIDLVQIVVDASGRSRCFGFVVFTNEQSVAKVLKQKKHKIHDKIVEVRKAEPKKPKSNYKKQHHKCNSKCPNSNSSHFTNQFPYNKETMVHWANIMYNSCGMPFLFNQRFQHMQHNNNNNNNNNNSNNNIPEYFPQFNPSGNYYTGSLENMPPQDYNN